MSLFGSSGIRGIVNKKITPELSRDIGRAVGVRCEEVIVGGDTRFTRDMVSSALISGLTSVGTDVKCAGMVPTPTLARAAADFDCGIMVTASHNPAPYNGIKLWNPDGSSFGTEQMRSIEDRIQEPDELPTWDKVGRTSRYEGAIDEHISDIVDIFDENFDLKVVVDCANGAGCLITPYLLKKMGCEVVTLNSQPDGTFPAHDSEPVRENLDDLSYLVNSTGADLGIAHDGDADRMVAFDGTGEFLDGDKLLALFTKEFSSSVVVPVNSSMVIEELADEVTRTKVGDVFVSEMLKEKKAKFGGEPSGTWIFPDMSYGPDGIYAAALLVKMCSEKSLSEDVADLPSYPRKKGSVDVASDKKRDIMDELTVFYKNTYPGSRLNFVDGIRFEEEEGWCLIRASGTEPKIRITVEAKDEGSLESIFKEAKKKIDCMIDKIAR